MSKYPNSGTLNKNENKRPDKNDPDYQGQAEVDGVAYWISSWVKTGPNGKFLSLSFKPKQPKTMKQEPPGKYGEPAGKDDFDDTIPFAFAFLAPAGLAVASAVYFFQPVVA